MFVTMFDDVTSSRLPATAEAVAGYCDANFAGVWLEDIHRFPKLALQQRVVSIATRTATTARIMDIEAGNPTHPVEGAAWVVRMVAHGVYRPGIYASLASMPAIKTALANTGLKRGQYVLWVADWNGLAVAHQLLNAGYDAVQYTDHGPDGTDVSLCKTEFFPPLAAPKPKPKPVSTTGKVLVSFEWPAKTWHVSHQGTRLTPEHTGRLASALLQMNTKTGIWSVRPLPWNAK